MIQKYILAIDQSTSGTKAILFDNNGKLIARSDLPHKQKIFEQGWVSHNPMEIFENTLAVVKNVVDKAKIDKCEIAGAGISNQRETAMIWNRKTGLPIEDAIVWQCGRAAEICNRIKDKAEIVRRKTGLNLSPYFSAGKISWLLENNKSIERADVCAGTMDSWLVYKLTNGKSFKTDFSNASRTQLMNLESLKWDEEICSLFNINSKMLAEICDSNSNFGETDFGGYLEKEIPIHAVLGDSHAALFGQGCLKAGMTKATYGTGSSVMMNIGDRPVFSENGIVSSLAWGMDGKVTYVLEGNINYTGSVIKWLVDDMKMLASSREAGDIAKTANSEDCTYLIPAFSGLGAPYWRSDVKATICGITRNTGRAEIVKAAEECIAYQIADIVKLMCEESEIKLSELRVDGGPTRDDFLMQFQSDILQMKLSVPQNEELSGIGAAYAAGIAVKMYDKEIFDKMQRVSFSPKMSAVKSNEKYAGWKEAVNQLIN